MRNPKAVLWLLMLMGAWELPANAASVPFTLNLSGMFANPNGIGGNPPVGTPFQPTSAAGTIMPFGQASAALQTTFNGSTVTAIITFTTADGSSFSGTFSGSATTGSPTLPLSGNITSGTGIFDKTSGSLNGAFTITNLSMTVPNLTYTITGTGTVNTQDSGTGLAVTPGGFTFSVAEKSTTPASQGLVVHNLSVNPVAFQAVPSSTGNWLSVSPNSVTATPYSNVPLTVTVNGSGLKAGVYQGQIIVSSATASITVFVELVVGPAGVYLQLSQTGLRYQGNPQGAPPPPQSIVVSNTGVGSLTGLTATASVLETGLSWLTATVVSSTASQVQVAVTANPKGLAVGKHFGQVAFSLPGSPNSPQIATVILAALPDEVEFFALEKNGGVFEGGVFMLFLPGNPNRPSPQFAELLNSGNVAGTFTAQVEKDSFPWLTVSPTSGSLPVGQALTELTVSTVSGIVNGLPAGDYSADIRVKYTPSPANGDDIIPVELFIASVESVPYSGNDGGFPVAELAATTCVPTQEVVFTTLRRAFSATAGQPTPIRALVMDNCANQVDSGSVVATFSNGDPPLPLTSVGLGEWSATWVPKKVAAEVNVTVQAQTLTSPLLSATRLRTGSVAAADPDTPIVNDGGVGSAANGVTTIAPGEFITIYGSNLRTGAADAPSTAPYPPSLDGIQVTLGGRVLPLAYSGAGQINAIVPYDVPPNTRQQLIVQTATAYSQPQNVTIAATQPGVFTQDQSGTGPGAIQVQKAGSSVSTLVTASNPASPGDALLIFCTGLGTVSPAVAAGAATPASPLSHTNNPVTVTIGGQSATVLFAGLAPGFVGLYQVNVTVPKGIAPATNVPLVMTVAGADSVPVTVAIK